MSVFQINVLQRAKKKPTKTATPTTNKHTNKQKSKCSGSSIGLDAYVAFLLLTRQPSNVSQRRPVSISCFFGCGKS